jgi:hypothetical protein
MFYINIRMTQLLNHITILSELRNSINCMNDLVQDETNNPEGRLLVDYTRIRDDLMKLYEFKRNIFTKKIMMHPIEFNCDMDEITDIVHKTEMKSSVCTMYEKEPLKFYEEMILEYLELETDFKERLEKIDPELLKKLNKK